MEVQEVVMEMQEESLLILNSMNKNGPKRNI